MTPLSQTQLTVENRTSKPPISPFVISMDAGDFEVVILEVCFLRFSSCEEFEKVFNRYHIYGEKVDPFNDLGANIVQETGGFPAAK